MSYREMRTFTEMMRSLGFPRLISMENFRQPNFPLVAEILAWLVLRYDSHADVPQCLDTEQDRVLFVKMIAHFMATRACIRLNTKKIYQANGFAVKELLKIAKVLYSAMCENRKKPETEQLDLCVTEMFDMSKKKELQEGRALSGQLASCGASLHALVGREADLREARDRAIRRQLDSEWVEKCVANARDELRGMVEKTETSLINIAADEANLDEKIEKKRSELERNRKRLSTLQSVRPAYMEEYEQLEEELGSWYSFYLTRFRNLAYLENQYEELIRSGSVGQGEDGEATLRAIADQLKHSGRLPESESCDKIESRKIDSSTRARVRKHKQFNGRDDLDDDDDDAERDDEDLIDGQDDDADQDDEDDDDDDDDDDDEDDDEEEDEDESDDDQDDGPISADPFDQQTEQMMRGVRNQLAPGWSPSRQYIPAASYRGRPDRNYDGDLGSGEPLEHGDGKIPAKHAKSFRLEKGAKSQELLGTGAEDTISNEDDDDGDIVPMSNVNDNFGTASTHDVVLHGESGTGGIRSQKNKRSAMNGVNKTVDEDEDDDF